MKPKNKGKESWKLYQEILYRNPDITEKEKQEYLQIAKSGLLAEYIEDCTIKSHEATIKWAEENKEVLHLTMLDEFLYGRSNTHMDENGKLTRLDPFTDYKQNK